MKKNTLHALHSTLYTLHSTFYTVHCTLYTLHSILHTLHFTLYTLHSTLFTSHFTLHTLHSTLYTLLHNPHFTLYTLHPPLNTPLSSHSTLCIPPPSTFQSLQCTGTVAGEKYSFLRDCIRVCGLHLVFVYLCVCVCVSVDRCAYIQHHITMYIYILYNRTITETYENRLERRVRNPS